MHDGHHGHTIAGSSQSDHLHANGGSITLNGFRGDDTLMYAADATNAHADMTILASHKGDDTLSAEVSTRGQVHMYGGDGDDLLVLDVTKESGFQSLLSDDPVQDASIGRHGHHVFGCSGSDIFEFRDVAEAENKVIGRIDDFDGSRDTISIDGQAIDLSDPPSNVRIVGYQGQQWILIDNTILYALEGARLESRDTEEVHFIHWPDEWKNGVPASADEAWIDQVNFVPYAVYSGRLDTLNRIDSTESSVKGSAAADYIYTNKTGGSSEMINGYGGDDVIHAGTGHDTVFGDQGDDAIAGGLDDDRLVGGDGNDSLWGGSEHDVLLGQQGADSLMGGTGDDILMGGEGSDQLHGNQGVDRIWGGDGNDEILGGQGHDTLGGGHGNDDVRGGSGRDMMWGGTGNDTLSGGFGNDTMYGGDGQDDIRAGDGSDVAWASDGADRLDGEDGEDALGGGAGNDTIWGGAGQDTLWGGHDNDTICGGTGDDFIRGGRGDDTLHGGFGSDTLIGGHGEDTFVFRTFGAAERDVVEDFEDNRDTLVFYGDLESIRDTDDGVLFEAANGYELLVENLTVSDIDSWDYMVM